MVRQITVNVRASLEAEANGATEGEVRGSTCGLHEHWSDFSAH